MINKVEILQTFEMHDINNLTQCHVEKYYLANLYIFVY